MSSSSQIKPTTFQVMKTPLCVSSAATVCASVPAFNPVKFEDLYDVRDPTEMARAAETWKHAYIVSHTYRPLFSSKTSPRDIVWYGKAVRVDPRVVRDDDESDDASDWEPTENAAEDVLPLLSELDDFVPTVSLDRAESSNGRPGAVFERSRPDRQTRRDNPIQAPSSGKTAVPGPVTPQGNVTGPPPILAGATPQVSVHITTPSPPFPTTGLTPLNPAPAPKVSAQSSPAPAKVVTASGAPKVSVTVSAPQAGVAPPAPQPKQAAPPIPAPVVPPAPQPKQAPPVAAKKVAAAAPPAPAPAKNPGPPPLPPRNNANNVLPAVPPIGAIIAPGPAPNQGVGVNGAGLPNPVPAVAVAGNVPLPLPQPVAPPPVVAPLPVVKTEAQLVEEACAEAKLKKMVEWGKTRGEQWLTLQQAEDGSVRIREELFSWSHALPYSASWMMVCLSILAAVVQVLMQTFHYHVLRSCQNLLRIVADNLMDALYADRLTWWERLCHTLWNLWRSLFYRSMVNSPIDALHAILFGAGVIAVWTVLAILTLIFLKSLISLLAGHAGRITPLILTIVPMMWWSMFKRMTLGPSLIETILENFWFGRKTLMTDLLEYFTQMTWSKTWGSLMAAMPALRDFSLMLKMTLVLVDVVYSNLDMIFSLVYFALLIIIISGPLITFCLRGVRYTYTLEVLHSSIDGMLKDLRPVSQRTRSEPAPNTRAFVAIQAGFWHNFIGRLLRTSTSRKVAISWSLLVEAVSPAFYKPGLADEDQQKRIMELPRIWSLYNYDATDQLRSDVMGATIVVAQEIIRVMRRNAADEGGGPVFPPGQA